MKVRRWTGLTLAVAALAALGWWLATPPAQAHCDTMAGPVIVDAQAALTAGDVTRVLKWVPAADEAEIKAAFDDALALRKLGDQAGEVGDLRFFETLVRVHRAYEGAPYTGLKHDEVDPVIALTDAALASGSADEVIAELTAAVEAGLRERFAHVREAEAHADHSVEAGREFVAAYVEWTHFAERLHLAATTSAAHGGAGHDGHAAPAAADAHAGH